MVVSTTTCLNSGLSKKDSLTLTCFETDFIFYNAMSKYVLNPAKILRTVLNQCGCSLGCTIRQDPDGRLVYGSEIDLKEENNTLVRVR